jgi:PKD repeat protein
MKKISRVYWPVLSLALFVGTFLGCTKETVEVKVQQPLARFSVLIYELYSPSYLTQATTNYIDSNFHFRNDSDSGTNISYRWNFGDGTSSTEKNPKHSYNRRGTYPVTLIVSNANKAFDTLQQNVSVILGQKNVSLSGDNSLSPVYIHETASNEFVLFATTGANYYLFQLDSLLRQKNMKMFPSTTRFNFIQATEDGNYLLLGSTQGTTSNNELIKMQPDGTILWNKVIPGNAGYNYIQPAQDGGYIAVGAKLVATPQITDYFTTVVKTDNNGNIQWEKVLDQEGIRYTNNAFVEADGIVVAGIRRSNCSDCDSVAIIKLNNNGNITWKTFVLGGMDNFGNWWKTNITKLSNGNFAVTNSYTRGLFFFSPSGDFIDRKLLGSGVADLINSGDGNIVALQGDRDRFSAVKIKLNGEQEWYAYPDGRQKKNNGYSCCFYSSPLSIQKLRKGGFLIAGSASLDNASNSLSHSVVLLMELDETGKLK